MNETYMIIGLWITVAFLNYSDYQPSSGHNAMPSETKAIPKRTTAIQCMISSPILRNITPMPARIKTKAPARESLRGNTAMPIMIRTRPNIRAPLVLLRIGELELSSCFLNSITIF